MWQPSYNRTPRTGSRSQMYNYKERQLRQQLTDQYERETDLEILSGKLKGIEAKHQEVIKKHNENLRCLIDEREITDARKKLAENIKPVEFEKEIINTRMDAIKADNENFIDRFGV